MQNDPESLLRHTRSTKEDAVQLLGPLARGAQNHGEVQEQKLMHGQLKREETCSGSPLEASGREGGRG